MASIWPRRQHFIITKPPEEAASGSDEEESSEDEGEPSTAVRNFYSEVKQVEGEGLGHYNRCAWLPQHPCRILVCGASGSGKTNWVMNLIAKAGKTYEEIWLVAKNLDEPLYKLLKRDPRCTLDTSQISDLPELKDIDGGVQRLVIFDDVLSCNPGEQKLITDFFIASRKQNCSCAYLTQDYFGAPVTIRRNCSYIVLLGPQPTKTLSMLSRDLARGVDPEKLMEWITDATDGKGIKSFFMVDLHTRNPAYRYRKGFRFEDACR